jgi:hypothetical protein
LRPSFVPDARWNALIEAVRTLRRLRSGQSIWMIDSKRTETMPNEEDARTQTSGLSEEEWAAP